MSFVGLNLAANTMLNSQKALEIVGLNITNSQTAGYTRQAAVQTIVNAGYTLESPSVGVITTGSMITEIARFRSQALDLQYRAEASVEGEVSAQSDYLAEVAEVFSDTSDFGLPTLLNEFWQSWNSASQDPTDVSLRQMVIEEGKTLSQSLRMKVETLDDISVRLDDDISTTVDRVNTIISEIASVNSEIIPSAPKTSSVNLLLDKRDLLLDELQGLVNVQIVGDSRESVSIYLDGSPLVSDKISNPLTLSKDTDGNYVISSSAGRELNVQGGKLRGLIDVKEESIGSYKEQLDEIADALITNVNNLHKIGYGLDESTGNDFFSGTSAADIQVSLSDSEKLALSVPYMVSESNINVDGSEVNPDETLQAGAANFKVTPDASGTVNINGVDVNWAETDTLQEILDNIYTATGITAKFDSTSQKITLSAPTDSSTITLVDVTGNFKDFTGLTGTTIPGAPGDGTNGLRIFELATKSIFGTPPSITINDKYKNLASEVGFAASSAQTKAEIQGEYLQSIEDMRQSVSGVSIDEETVDLIRYQRTFQAGAKLATVCDEMLQTLINMV